MFCIFRKLKERDHPSMLSSAVRRLSPLQWAGVGLGSCAVLLALLGRLRPALSFPAAQSLGQRGALVLASAFSVWQAQSWASSTKPSSSASGLWLSSILLDIVESELCIRLGLRQLPAQAVRRRSRLCPECRRGPCVHLRLHGRRLHQFHHPLHRVPVLPHEPHRR